METVNLYRGEGSIKCESGKCPHYGRCLPVAGLRDTPEHAVGEHTREKGEYYHNIISAEKQKGWWSKHR